MFDTNIVVQSAISAFNNAALFAPAFLWWAILAMPIFWLTYVFGPQIAKRLGLTPENAHQRIGLWTVILSGAWVVMFGGNYGVLRDSTSLLPFLVAAIVFVVSMFIGSYTNTYRLSWRPAHIILTLAIITGLILSDTHAWWGPLLQIGAALTGALIGRASGRKMRSVPGTLLITLAITTAILMQPEFFRFGQLGSLTLPHMLGILCVGVAAAATVALRNVAPRGRIHNSAFTKLKWLARFVSALALILFILTESIPVFIGSIFAVFLMFALSIWHCATVNSNLGDRTFAITLGAFGVITVMPTITALGIIYWTILPNCQDAWRDGRFLL